VFLTPIIKSFAFIAVVLVTAYEAVSAYDEVTSFVISTDDDKAYEAVKA